MILSDLLVIELASVLAGPSLGMFLAEQGANVIKIENPGLGGDVTRGWRLPDEGKEDDRSAYFCAVNWGKKSIGLNLKDSSDLETVHQLISKADILITSFRPGQAKQYNLDAPYLQEQFPKLIIASISGYGPGDMRPAFDAIIQAETGFTYLNGPAGKGQEKMPVALMDILAAHQLKEGVLLSLLKRVQTGQGGLVEVDLLSAGLASLANQATNYLTAGTAPQPIGSAHPNIAPYGEVFETKTGPIVLAVGNDRQFNVLCEVLDWQADARFDKNVSRVQHRTSLNSMLTEKIAHWDRHALLTQLSKKGVPAGPINSIPEAMDLPQARALQIKEGKMHGLRSFVADLGEELVALSAPPHFNQHEQEIRTKWL